MKSIFLTLKMNRLIQRSICKKPFTEMREVVQNYPITSEESEEDNTYLSYNKVVGTSLDEKLYPHLRFGIMHCCLHREHRLRKPPIDAGIGKDISGSFDSGIYQPVFSIACKECQRGAERGIYQYD